MSAGTSVTAEMATAVHQHGTGFSVGPERRWVMNAPATWDEMLALPEHDGAVCPQCESVAYVVRGVWACGRESCGYRWRWHGEIGGD